MTKTAIISDIHANLEALTAVLSDIHDQQADRIICLGDIVDYGADPNHVIKLLQHNNVHSIRGNHDEYIKMITQGNLDFTRYITATVNASINWTHKRLTPKNKTFLSQLPLTITEKNVLYVHASPVPGQETTSCLSPVRVQQRSTLFDYIEKICFIGHTHVPMLAEQTPDGNIHFNTLTPTLPLNPHSKYLINPGSTGQPRDGNPEASYCIHDNNTITFRRVPYDTNTAARKIRLTGMPDDHAERLFHGI